MARARRLSILLMLISLALASKGGDDFSRCENIVRKWAESSADNGIKADKLTLKDLLFFLHVPRTGGRTYYYCFLKKLYANTDECPRSYDKLRFDPREPKCRLLVTHDDYSLMSKLPKDKTSVVTILRNPIDRVFSTYEFAVEVAARFLVHPNLTSVMQMTRKMISRSRGVSTLDIWPWKYLVPWMREDLFFRRDARKHAKVRSIEGMRNPYDISEVVMPLHAFVDDPMAHEIIHNGATFQLAGLTNNSFLAESPQIRRCVRRHPNLGHYVLEVAKGRLENMLYIGLTEDHKESATIFANMVGSQVLSQSEALSSLGEEVASNGTEMGLFKNLKKVGKIRTSTGVKKVGEDAPPSPSETTDKNMTVEKLMEAYETCTSSLRKSQSKRRTLSLRQIFPANFSKKARLHVPQTVIQKILLMNSLDVELYKHAQKLFEEQSKHLMQINHPKSESQLAYLPSQMETQVGGYDLNGYITWKVISLICTTLFFIFVGVVVTKRKRTSKIKV
ncbi:protein-tyrosine sulfotransferase [Phalaenopsis equestris]|uniref:protein-tyrosine sulfotransferase n=1 Tax=Phalaenopsis equestris TaxID=78828 RepID=UPI0009E5EAC3|nr:protein-tyrosine sulfotransferase [Phalaenopsis equestris]